MASWLFQPVIDFLKNEGLWDQAHSVFVVLKALLEKMVVWAGTHGITAQTLYEWFVAFWKFVFKLTIVFADIIIKAVQWIAERF